jgi:hypothetical protein
LVSRIPSWCRAVRRSSSFVGTGILLGTGRDGTGNYCPTIVQGEDQTRPLPRFLLAITTKNPPSRPGLRRFSYPRFSPSPFHRQICDGKSDRPTSQHSGNKREGQWEQPARRGPDGQHDDRLPVHIDAIVSKRVLSLRPLLRSMAQSPTAPRRRRTPRRQPKRQPQRTPRRQPNPTRVPNPTRREPSTPDPDRREPSTPAPSSAA